MYTCRENAVLVMQPLPKLLWITCWDWHQRQRMFFAYEQVQHHSGLQFSQLMGQNWWPLVLIVRQLTIRVAWQP